MKVVVQRVKRAEVNVNGESVGKIESGALIFLGVAQNDTEQDADYLIRKVLHLRMFADADGKMNISGLEAKAEFLVVSQFTLYGNCEKGRRPSFDEAAPPQEGERLYEYFVAQMKQQNVKVATGRFQAMMDVSLINDGPVTFIIESK